MLKQKTVTLGVLAITMTLALAMWLSLQLPLIAQPIPVPGVDQQIGTGTPGPDGFPLTQSPEEIEQQNIELATLQAEYQTRSIFNYHIAYLIAEDAASLNEMTTPEQLETLVGAKVSFTWDDFLRQNTELPFQMVLVHVSMYDQLDLEWTQFAYRNNVLLVGINFNHAQVVAMTGDNCQRDLNPHLPENFFPLSVRYFVYSVNLEDERYRDNVDQGELQDCTENYEDGGTAVGIYHGTIHSPIKNAEIFDNFVRGLTSEARNYNMPKDYLTLPLPESTTK